MSWRKWLLIAVGILLLMVLGGGLYLRSWINSDAGGQIVAVLEERLQVPVTAESVDFELGNLLLMSPTATIKGLTIGNPEGFLSPYLLKAEEVSAQVRLQPALLDRRLEIPDFAIFSPDVKLERDEQGRSNLQIVLERASQSDDSNPAAAEAGGSGWTLAIERLALDSGSFEFITRRSGAAQTTSADDINLLIADFSPDQSSPLQFSARLFGGQRSKVDLDGHAGPFDEGRFPIEGQLVIDAALQEMDREARTALLGNFLAEPGQDSLIHLRVHLQGDAAQSLQGEGRLELSDFYLGKSEDNRLAAQGDLPIRLTARNLLDSPQATLRVPDGSLNLGDGSWSGQIEMEITQGELKGNSRGSISNIDINRFLSAFTESEDKVFGTLIVPEYTLRFSGSNAEQITDSLQGQGQFLVESGRIAAFGIIDRMRRALDRQQAQSETVTEFSEIASPFQIDKRRFSTPDLRLTSSAITLTAQGSLGFDRSLDYQAQADLQGGLESLLGPQGAALARFLPEGKIPVRITGTFDEPHMRPDLSGSGQGAILGILDKLLKPKEEDEQKPPPGGDR
ncbi:MAG TPA: AsmA-like C-terminal region-containing protein [Acidobacteriota bacterium]|nr:AsmA-like C-terminal region-containing protein [Acidobacteriota bacterium]